MDEEYHGEVREEEELTVQAQELKFDPAERTNKRLPMPGASQLPELVRRNYGSWADRKFHESGIIEHISKTGESLFTVKVGLPPNSRLSSKSLRKIVEVADAYGLKSVRATRGMNLEFLADSLDNARKIVEEMGKSGFPAGGWKNSLWHITSCTAYLTCTTAVVDAPTVTKVLYDRLFPYFAGQNTLPAKLMVFVSGCTNVCAGTLGGDIVLVGHWGQVPKPDPERIKFCLPSSGDALKKVTPDVAAVCPVGAIRLSATEDNKVAIAVDDKKCIACGRCKNVCDYFDWDPDKIGVAIFVGGKTSHTGSGPRLGYRIIPWLPVTPPDYKEITAAVSAVIDLWKSTAHEGERIGDTMDRIGVGRFTEMLGVPVSRHNMPAQVDWNFGVRQFVKYV